MNSPKLTPEQLNKLVAYIDSRGFHAQSVIMEILDHFACKVEEKMQEDSNLSFEDAIVAAHRDFGTLGFYVLAAQNEKQLKARYKKYYWSHFKGLVTSLKYIPLLILLGVFYFKGWMFAELHDWKHILGFNDIMVTIFAIFVIVHVYFLLHRSVRDVSIDYNVQVAYNSYMWISVALIWTIPNLDHYKVALWVPALYTATVGVYCFIDLMIRVQVYQLAIKDSKEINRFFNEMQVA